MYAVIVGQISIPVAYMIVKSSVERQQFFFVTTYVPFSYEMCRVAQLFQILKNKCEINV
jgi:hypothetical protein